jgi:hypothetical protein
MKRKYQNLLRKTSILQLLALHFGTTKRMKKFKKNVKVEPVFKFIQNYRANWKERIERMDVSRIPNNILNYMEKEA